MIAITLNPTENSLSVTRSDENMSYLPSSQEKRQQGKNPWGKLGVRLEQWLEGAGVAFDANFSTAPDVQMWTTEAIISATESFKVSVNVLEDSLPNIGFLPAVSYEEWLKGAKEFNLEDRKQPSREWSR